MHSVADDCRRDCRRRLRLPRRRRLNAQKSSRSRRSSTLPFAVAGLRAGRTGRPSLLIVPLSVSLGFCNARSDRCPHSSKLRLKLVFEFPRSPSSRHRRRQHPRARVLFDLRCNAIVFAKIYLNYIFKHTWQGSGARAISIVAVADLEAGNRP